MVVCSALESAFVAVAWITFVSQKRFRSASVRTGYKMSVKGLLLQPDGLTKMRHFANVSPDSTGKQHMRAIATLYDSHTATMFGAQCISTPVLYSEAAVDAGALRFDFDVFWHTRIRDAGVVILLQFTMASLGSEQMLVNEYCVGWCRLPISMVRSHWGDAACAMMFCAVCKLELFLDHLHG